ncbi:unnamed protein product [Bemisia tabaci]|uniref:Uncharacterized protein n=1 Tax=Bemisia tabaci TaxID=7038 RepID=A0A9P0AN82_BEMTA|nr:unnamed protein product [Bemisia tabaci]
MDLSKETKPQLEQLLYNATLLTEAALELREKSISSDKYSSYLRSLAWRATRASSIIQQTSRNCLNLAQRIATSCSKTLEILPEPALRQQTERLLFILEKELIDVIDFDLAENPFAFTPNNPNNLSEKLRNLESRVKLDSGYLSQCSSAKSFKQDVDEKYPENCSRESLFDFNVMNLPPVPEDISMNFNKIGIPSHSQSSLRSLRKVKHYTQKAMPSDESEESENDDQDIASISGEGRHSYWELMKHVNKRKTLGNIKEESSQDL